MFNTWHLPTFTDSCQFINQSTHLFEYNCHSGQLQKTNTQHHWCKRSSADCSEKLSKLVLSTNNLWVTDPEQITPISSIKIINRTGPKTTLWNDAENWQPLRIAMLHDNENDCLKKAAIQFNKFPEIPKVLSLKMSLEFMVFSVYSNAVETNLCLLPSIITIAVSFYCVCVCACACICVCLG